MKELDKQESTLVFMPQGKDREPFTTSNVIAEWTGNSYRSVQRIIENQSMRLEQFGVMRFEITLPSKGSKGGRPKKVYHLNEQQATLLITFLKNTDTVANFKVELVRQFYEMRALLLERSSPIWQDTRSLSKEARRMETDAIKALVTYAKAQGSRNADRYYCTLSKLADRIAGIENRDKAQVVQLTSLLLVEKLIAWEIETGIQAEHPYKEIYKDIKSKLALLQSLDLPSVRHGA